MNCYTEDAPGGQPVGDERFPVSRASLGLAWQFRRSSSATRARPHALRSAVSSRRRRRAGSPFRFSLAAGEREVASLDPVAGGTPVTVRAAHAPLARRVPRGGPRRTTRGAASVVFPPPPSSPFRGESTSRRRADRPRPFVEPAREAVSGGIKGGRHRGFARNRRARTPSARAPRVRSARGYRATFRRSS